MRCRPARSTSRCWTRARTSSPGPGSTTATSSRDPRRATMTLYFEPKPERAKAMVDALGTAARAAKNVDDLFRLVDSDRSEQLVVFGPQVRLAEAMMFANKQRLHRPSLGV